MLAVHTRKSFVRSLALAFLLMGLAFCVPAISHAAIVPACNPLPGQPNSCGVKHIFELVVNIYNFLLGAAALVAMLFVVVGGIRMFFLAASESELENAKHTVKYAIVGFVMIACAYLIVNTLIFVLGGGGLQQLFQRLGLGAFGIF